ncbi:hypothetical protein [Caballeronia terrestris]|uniref:hypothetical protein n=1 Tax=Caballeronia terrestris TaxID=1226301 RepID=UPI001F39F22F|nr:hypothetical protein [Caballeronia terrestris]
MPVQTHAREVRVLLNFPWVRLPACTGIVAGYQQAADSGHVAGVHDVKRLMEAWMSGGRLRPGKSRSPQHLVQFVHLVWHFGRRIFEQQNQALI